MATLVVRPGPRMAGSTRVPGDKSISHRGLLLGAAAGGRTVLRGLAPGADVRSTAACLRAYRVRVEDDNGQVEIEGEGLRAWSRPSGPLDCGNSGTTMRVLAGLAARCSFETVLDGDASLRGRPMERVAAPLRAMGATVRTHGGRAPVRVSGGALLGAEVVADVASAQVKSAVLLAGLGASGTTSVTEPAPSRDHTERMLAALGVPLTAGTDADGRPRIEVEACEVPPFELDVPGDPSSAAFVVAAAVLAGSVAIDDVCLNPTRVGFLSTLVAMGASVSWEADATRMGEPVGTIRAERSPLAAATVAERDLPTLHDEIPLLAVLAAGADGETRITGAAELRVKESDRIETTCEGLRSMGADVSPLPDGLVVRGPRALRGADVDAHGDHRIALAFAVAGLAASGETRVHGFEAAAVSWPGFERTLQQLGADVVVEP